MQRGETSHSIPAPVEGEGAQASESALDRAIAAATRALVGCQRRDGHWVFELEADATIPAEYVALQHFLGEPNPALETRIARYLRRQQIELHRQVMFPPIQPE